MPKGKNSTKIENAMDFFLEKYIANRFNATQAYMEVYKPRNRTVAAAAARMLGKVNVQKALAQKLERLLQREKVDVNQARVIQELNRVGYSSISALLEWDGKGAITFKPSAGLDADTLATVKGIKCVRRIGYTKDGEEYETVTIELMQHDKMAALGLLARIAKLVSPDKPVGQITFNLNFRGNKST